MFGRWFAAGLMHVAAVLLAIQPLIGSYSAAFAQAVAPTHPFLLQPLPRIPGTPQLPPSTPLSPAPSTGRPHLPSTGTDGTTTAPSGPQETRPASARAKEALFDRLPNAAAIATLVPDKVRFVDAVYDLKEMVAARRHLDPAFQASIEERMALRQAAAILRGRAALEDGAGGAQLASACASGACVLAQYAPALPAWRLAAQAVFAMFLAVGGARVMPWASGLLGPVLLAAMVVAMVAACVGIANSIGGRCGRGGENPEDDGSEDGDCEKDQKNDLQRQVKRYCNDSGKLSCTTRNMTRADIALIKEKILRCITARKAIMDICYRGGDDTHHQQIEQRNASLRTCNNAIPID